MINPNSIFLFFGFCLAVISLIILSKLLRVLIIKQINDQMKEMIPIKLFRDRIGIKIKLKK